MLHSSSSSGGGGRCFFFFLAASLGWGRERLNLQLVGATERREGVKPQRIPALFLLNETESKDIILKKKKENPHGSYCKCGDSAKFCFHLVFWQ